MTSRQIVVTGSLINDRGIWTVRARVFDPQTGQTKQRSKSTGFRVQDRTKRKAERAMRDILAAFEQEANEEATPRKQKDPLFQEYVNRFLDTMDATKRNDTAQSYRSFAELHILPALGKYKLTELNRQILQDYANQKLQSLSVSSVKKHFVVIRGALDNALFDNCISANPAKGTIRFPPKKRYEGRALEQTQVDHLIKVLQEQHEPIRSAITLALAYGLRRSEICGLRWADVDFENAVIHIANTRVEYNGTITEAEATKTKGSFRNLPLVGWSVPYLKELREKHEAKGFDTGKVCCYEDGREVRPEYVTRSVMRFLQKTNGFENITLHSLRHTAASLLVRNNCPVKQVQEFLGHTDVSTTLNIYTHVTPEDMVRTSQLMSEILSHKSDSCSGICSGNDDVMDGKKAKCSEKFG